jgi:hypothetical protein
MYMHFTARGDLPDLRSGVSRTHDADPAPGRRGGAARAPSSRDGTSFRYGSFHRPYIGPITLACGHVRSDISLQDVSPKDKPLSWLHGEVKTPPFSASARIETGFLLRRLQHGEVLSMPQSRPMPELAPRCHELRVPDRGQT